MKLTARQALFVEQYLIDLNATQAAIRAGYSQKTAEQIGYQSLQRPQIQAAIKAATAARSKRTQIDADWVLRRLAMEIEADLAELYDEKGALKPISDWPMIWRQGLVAGVETVQEFEEVDGRKVPIGLVHKVKLSDRIRRLELIGKHIAVGAFAEKHEHTGKDGGPIQTEEITETERARRIAFVLTQGVRETVQ